MPVVTREPNPPNPPAPGGAGGAGGGTNMLRPHKKIANMVPLPKGRKVPSPEDTAIARQRSLAGQIQFSRHPKKAGYINALAAKLGAA